MNVGEYARLKNGEIVKMVDVKVYYVLGQNAKDDYSCVTSKNNDFPSLIQNDFIVKKGKIIDLIEKGDYANGYLVIEEPYTYHDIKFISVDTQDSWGWGKGEMPAENIKTIVTHEQMEAIQYRVEE